ncbi:ABC transporter permease [Actinomycetospora termitidis]|uniref:ABC transporter permease subunit n=1 Tax=Actinomycetospora termitidis TaxID=3053470 RepID=A0ABT7M4U2_9PSEU|nr:ABC transporter permease subunit [Actinomycetospora sp. Odt1-22]MDL5155568.1 ABC transporter permease subunit [Actinomycetospora sp. Odt1-22]
MSAPTDDRPSGGLAPGVAPGRSGGGFAREALAAVARRLAPVAVSLAVILVLWTVFLQVFGVRALIGKNPWDVLEWLFLLPASAANRAQVLGDLGVTFVDAGIGYVAGLVAAALAASVFVLSRPLEQALMPIATLLRSVPLVAMTPLIVLAFGRGLTATGVIGAIVVFFPALVTMVFGLRSSSPWAMELVTVYGGGRLSRLRRVMLPSAVPAFFAAARVGVPAAMVGALMAEWLATGRGSGTRMITAVAGFRYIEMWAAVTVVTAACVAVYALVGIIESLVVARMGLD